MSRIANLLTLSLIVALALSWGWVLNTALAGESKPDDRRQPLAQVSPQTGSSFTASSDEPGVVAQYTITFTATADYAPGRDNLVIKLRKFNEYRFHFNRDDIKPSTISIRPEGSNSANPQAVDWNGSTMTITLPDFDPTTEATDADADQINSGESVTVTIQKHWLIRNPTECGDYPVVISGPGPDLTTPALTIRCVVELSVQEGLRGTRVTATGTGFKNSTTLSFFLDSDIDGALDSGEFLLCTVAQVGPDDIGSCDFTVNDPSSLIFLPGDNFINAVDGRGQYAGTTRHSDQRFVLRPSLSIDPASAVAASDTVTVYMHDFPYSEVSEVTLDGYSAEPIGGYPAIGTWGDRSFQITIPSDAQGIAELRVTAGGESVTHIIIITAPAPSPTPTPAPTATPYPTPTPTRSVPPASIALSPTSGAPGTVVTVSVVGASTFERVQSIFVGDVDVTLYPLPSIDSRGSALFEIRIPNLAPGSFPVEVQVAGSNARATFTVTPASVTLSPTSSAPGTEVLVKVEGANTFVPVRVLLGDFDVTPYPSPYTTGRGMAEFYILIPNLAPGNFPIEVTAGSSNVRGAFTVTAATTPTPTPAAPQLVIPGNEPPHLFIGRATLNGNAVGAGVSVQAYDGGKLIGATVTQAGGTFTIHVHRSAGVITFRVNNQAAAESWPSWSSGQVNHSFNLSAGGSRTEDNPSRLFAAMPDLVRAFVFDNATKGWNFFDPVVAEASTLTRFMPQHSYWLLVSHTTRLLLNGVERQLTCVEGNCWNLIVW